MAKRLTKTVEVLTVGKREGFTVNSSFTLTVERADWGKEYPKKGSKTVEKKKTEGVDLVITTKVTYS